MSVENRHVSLFVDCVWIDTLPFAERSFVPTQGETHVGRLSEHHKTSAPVCSGFCYLRSPLRLIFCVRSSFNGC